MIVRPGLIVGPHDPTDRFTYWVRRMVEGGAVLAPESPDVAQTQVVDAARAVPDGDAPADADVVWVPWGFLERQGVQPWTDLPAWVPAPMLGLLAANGSKAAAHGLTHKPIEDVVAGVAAWDRARRSEPLRTGMTREREAELLRTFRAEARPPGP